MTELTAREILDAIRRGLEATARQFTDTKQKDPEQRRPMGNEKGGSSQSEAKASN